ncbi:MAG: DUF5618 family protein [Bacteroidetes bacterium]|nr:DUF5618 family protein [Bacteroidota bacterium]
MQTVQKKAYLEAKRYIDNARKILSSSAGKEGEYYTDPKYVKMACNTAYTGILVAIDKAYNVKKGKTLRPDVDTYRKVIGGENRKMLNNFNSAYNYLHLLGGYDGDLNVNTSQTGLQLADTLIEWLKPKIA